MAAVLDRVVHGHAGDLVGRDRPVEPDPDRTRSSEPVGSGVEECGPETQTRDRTWLTHVPDVGRPMMSAPGSKAWCRHSRRVLSEAGHADVDREPARRSRAQHADPDLAGHPDERGADLRLPRGTDRRREQRAVGDGTTEGDAVAGDAVRLRVRDVVHRQARRGPPGRTPEGARPARAGSRRSRGTGSRTRSSTSPSGSFEPHRRGPVGRPAHQPRLRRSPDLDGRPARRSSRREPSVR